MLLGSVQICGEKISHKEANDLCKSLNENQVRLLSLRGCKIKESDYLALVKSFGRCKSLLQLNLNLKVVKSLPRAVALSEALVQNRSLTSLFLHGCTLGFSGVAVLVKGLTLHPSVVSLDLGDCKLTDSALLSIADLLPPNGAKRGLQDLTLSANPGITPHGWSKFFIAMSASHTLRSLHIDYNNIMDYGMGCLSVVLASSSTLHTLDVEGAGITELGAQTLLYLVRNFPVSVQAIVLAENNISEKTRELIETALQENSSMKSSEGSMTTSMETESTDKSGSSSESESESESETTLSSSKVVPRLHPSARSTRVMRGRPSKRDPQKEHCINTKMRTYEMGPNLSKLTQSVMPPDATQKFTGKDFVVPRKGHISQNLEENEEPEEEEESDDEGEIHKGLVKKLVIF